MDAAKDANSNLKIEMARIGGWNLKVQLRLSSHSAQKIIEFYLKMENDEVCFFNQKSHMTRSSWAEWELSLDSRHQYRESGS